MQRIIFFIWSLTIVGVLSTDFRARSYIVNHHSESGKKSPDRSYGRQKVIIDTDAGVDDAHAILMILANPDFEVIAITCVVGNSELKSVEKNVLHTLTVANRLDIPVYGGASDYLAAAERSTFENPPYFGTDGFGDVDPPLPYVNLSMIESEPAALAIIRLAKEYSGKISLLAIAPLTNIAIAIRLDPELTNNLKEMVIMGGNNAGQGSETLAAEFNFHRDPEAAGIVLKEEGCLISLVNWEACLQTADIDQRFHHAFFHNSNTEQGRFIHRINKLKNDRAYAQAKRLDADPVFILGDEVAAALLIEDGVCDKSAYWPTDVELCGRFTRGQCVVDKRGFLPDRINLRNCHQVDIDIVKDNLQKMIDYDFSRQHEERRKHY